MDNYEYKLKIEQIEKLVRKKDFITASKIADGIDWMRHRKETATLSMIADLYDHAGRPEECYEILQMLCERLKTRRILYRMVEVALKMGDFEKAKDLYEEFVSIAPKDLNKYLLKYRICRATGRPLDVQIEALEKYRMQEHVEEWAYELACLYEEAGLIEQCIEECNEIILWFSEGEYVIKALELKMRYCELTAAEQQKYECRFEQMQEEEPEEETEDVSEDEADAAQNAETDREESTEEFVQEATDGEENAENGADELPKISVEDIAEDDTPKIQEVNLQKFSTINLQEELAASMRELFESETENEAELKETDFEEAGAEEPAEEEFSEMVITQEFVPIRGPVWRVEAEKEENREQPEEVPAEEVSAAEVPAEEIQPEETEKEEVPAEEAQEDEAAENEDKSQGELQTELLKYAADSVEKEKEPLYAIENDGQLCLMIEEENVPDKQITGQLTIGEILEAWEEKKRQEQAKAESEKRTAVLCETGEITGMLEDFIPTTPREEEKVEVEDETELWKEEPEVVELEDDLPQDVDVQDDIEEFVEVEDADQAVEIEEAVEEAAEEVETEAVEEAVEAEETEAVEEAAEEVETEAVEEAAKAEEAEAMEETAKVEEPKRSSVIGENTASMLDAIERALALEIAPLEAGKPYLTEEQEKIFAYFTSVRGMKKQLIRLLEEEHSRDKGDDSKSGNLLITGHPGNGKTTLAIDIVKALQKQRGVKGARIAKVTGDGLNKKNPQDVLAKVGSGALIIERAGCMDDATIENLSMAMEGFTGGILVILEDSEDEINRMMSRHEAFAEKFNRTVNIPIFSNDELVTFGKSYAEEQEYYFEEMAVLALYDSIGMRQTAEHVVNVAEVKEIIDQAIAHAQRRSKGFFARFSRRRVNEDGNRLLLEEDFQN